jgi:hypothetical protein
VLDGAVREIGVVEPEDVAGLHLLQWVVLEHGSDEAGAGERDLGVDHAATGVVEADEVVFLLLDQGAHGGAVHQRLHLVDGGAQRTGDQLQGDRVERHGASCAPAAC